MKSIIRFIIKNHFTIIFVIIELISLLLVINYNSYQRSVFMSSSNHMTGNLYESYSNSTEYFMLKEVNNELAQENAYLRSRLPESFKASRDYFNLVFDSLSQQEYVYRSAKVINNSTNKRFNYLTLDKGRNHGLEPEMGVISSRGVVGIVKNISNNYSTIISLLNTRLKISAKLKASGYFGALEWDGGNYQFAYLNEIPRHAKVNVGDLVVTSGYSSIFPEDILIGHVDEVRLNEGESFFVIKVKLSVDFKNLSYVEVIGHPLKNEQLQLEDETEND